MVTGFFFYSAVVYEFSTISSLQGAKTQS